MGIDWYRTRWKIPSNPWCHSKIIWDWGNLREQEIHTCSPWTCNTHSSTTLQRRRRRRCCLDESFKGHGRGRAGEGNKWMNLTFGLSVVPHGGVGDKKREERLCLNHNRVSWPPAMEVLCLVGTLMAHGSVVRTNTAAAVLANSWDEAVGGIENECEREKLNVKCGKGTRSRDGLPFFAVLCYCRLLAYKIVRFNMLQ